MIPKSGNRFSRLREALSNYLYFRLMPRRAKAGRIRLCA